jgi:hypothetical protein
MGRGGGGATIRGIEGRSQSRYYKYTSSLFIHKTCRAAVAATAILCFLFFSFLAVCVFIFFLERIVETCKLNSGAKSSLTNYFERDLCCVLCIWVGGEGHGKRRNHRNGSFRRCVRVVGERERDSTSIYTDDIISD